MNDSAPCAQIPFFRPSIDDDDVAAVVETLRSGWLTTGPKAAELERRTRELSGADAALACLSGTAGLHLSLLALGIGPGDEVVTSALTCAATVNVICQARATPVVCDVEPATLNVDPERVAAAITPRTRAIVAVHYAGHPCDLDALTSIAAERGLAVVEDAAHALGGVYSGRPIGGDGTLASFSFYATKLVTTGEGGMLVGPAEQVERARVMGLHGIDRSVWERRGSERVAWYDVVYPGLKYNMTDIAASLGLSQLAKLESFLARRAEIAERYTTAFAAVPELEPPTVRPDVRPTWHLYTLRIADGGPSAEDVIRGLAERGIQAARQFRRVDDEPFFLRFGGRRAGPTAIAGREVARTVSLPVYPGLGNEDVDRVASAVIDVVTKSTARVTA